MGVPSFYRWLVNKYPSIVVNAIEAKGDDTIDKSKPNPNGMEFDNLYLDMNGIIHPCFHQEDQLYPSTTFDEVFNSIFGYIDRLFNIVRPRRLLYMAIDGVAPRAKMNQQRSRRYRSAKDAETAELEEERLRREFMIEGKEVLPKLETEISDSNVITPGTEFMYKLSKALQGYIHLRLNKDPGWKNIKVILSDANVPGEGEHKIMSFIRLQRNLPGYNPNTRHCLYGLDADLIMLALATHELHFSILREDVLMQDQQPNCTVALEKNLCRVESELRKSKRWFRNVHTTNGGASLARKPYQFLNIWTLREYLELDFIISDPPKDIHIDLERIVDDFIFICFFTGNDFLPHMPTLEIHEGAIDLLMHVYKSEFKNMGGYLVDMSRTNDKNAGYLKLKRVEKFILAVGTYEERIFKKRSEIQAQKVKKLCAMMNEMDMEDSDAVKEDLVSQGSTHSLRLNCNTLNETGIDDNRRNCDILENTNELKRKLKDFIRDKSDLLKHGTLKADKVRLGTNGWRERYYKEKFSAENPGEVESTRKDLVKKFTEGLCWVLLYYFSGVPSWTWYYPYHYGPFASDLKGLAQVRVRFQMGSPFKPFDQLMAVLPPRSAHAIPKAYRDLMTSEESNIIDFYPSDFEVDTDGKRYMWQGIAKLEFIQEERLLQETRNVEKELMAEDVKRNTETVDKMYVTRSHDFGSQILALYRVHISGKEHTTIRIPIEDTLSGGIKGFIRFCDENLDFICPMKDMEDIEDDVIFLLYELPDSQPHTPRLLENVKLPEKMITEADILKTQLWHEYDGWRPISQIRDRYRKEETRGKFIPPDQSSANDIWKGARSGWGAGRGKVYPVTMNSGPNFEYSSRNPVGNGRGVGRGKVYPVTMNSGPKFESFSRTPVGNGRGAGRGKVYPGTMNSGPNFESYSRTPVGNGRGYTSAGSILGNDRGYTSGGSILVKELKGDRSKWGTTRHNGYPEASNSDWNVGTYRRIQNVDNGKVTSTGLFPANVAWKAVGSIPGNGRGNGSLDKWNSPGTIQPGSSGFKPASDVWRANSTEISNATSGRGRGKGQFERATQVIERGGYW